MASRRLGAFVIGRCSALDGSPNSRVRPATAEEVIVFGHMSKAAKPSDDLMLAYLVELDCRE